jgi:hypothetical protein
MTIHWMRVALAWGVVGGGCCPKETCDPGTDPVVDTGTAPTETDLDASGTWTGLCEDTSLGTATLSDFQLVIVDADGELTGTFTVYTGYSTGPTTLPYDLVGTRTGADVVFDLGFGQTATTFVQGRFEGAIAGDTLNGEIVDEVGTVLACSFTR